MSKVKMVCCDCGSEDVLCDAYAMWSNDAQAWEIANTFNKGAYCNKCEGETQIESEPLDAPDLGEVPRNSMA